MADLNELTKDMHEATHALRDAVDASEKRFADIGETSGELTERMEKAEAGIQKAEDAMNAMATERKEAERLRGELETKVQLLERHRGGHISHDEAKAHSDLVRSVFRKALRGGMPDVKSAVVDKWRPTELEMKAWAEEQKGLSTDSGPAGGYTMPPETRGALIEKLIEIDPMLELADSVTLTDGDTWSAPREGSVDFECNWVGERAARPETTAARFGNESVTAHEIYAAPRASQKSIDDSGLDIESWLNRRLVRRFGVKVGQATIVGDSDGKPEGITANAVAIVAYNGTTSPFGYTPLGDASAVTADGVIDMFYALPEFYANAATWLMHRSTIRDIRKLKSTTENEYLWAPGFEAAPPTILNRPYREAISMPTVASNAFAVALGDWGSAYLTVRRQEISVLRDPYTAKPNVEFYTTARFGGGVVLNEAYRLGKIATS